MIEVLTYREKYLYLKKAYNSGAAKIHLEPFDTDIFNIPFESQSWKLLPGAGDYECEEHQFLLNKNFVFEEEEQFKAYPDFLKHEDADIRENKRFNYVLFHPRGIERAKGVIILLHGLNEKYWEKYLPWAQTLAELTGKSVILFPTAFHMNRAPLEWSSSRTIKDTALLRQKYSPSITNATFANAAISARIQMIPQRFFWSGLQTFEDVTALVKSIKADEHPMIEPSASFDFFTYSIGSFLGEILLMDNPHGYFTGSRLFMFCGGTTLDRMSPNSKFILDSDAAIALYSFYIERLDNELKRDKRMAHYFNGSHSTGNYFRCMLSYQKGKELREKRLREICGRITAIVLKQDSVIPPVEVLNTLKGDFRDIPAEVEILDFPYPYSHITPFPANDAAVDEGFEYVFGKAGLVLSSEF